MRNNLAYFAVLLISFSTSIATAAPLVTFNITAVVDFVNDPTGILAGNVLVNDLLTGTLQYDLALSDLNPDANFGFYLADSPGDNFFNGTSGAAGSFETTEFMNISVRNNLGGIDSINILASGDTTPSLLQDPIIDFVDLEIRLEDIHQTALAGGSLPTNLRLSDFEIADVKFLARNQTTTHFTVVASITSITKVIGDFDNDGDADGADFLEWQRDDLGAEALALWQNTYGVTTSTSSATTHAIPEPSTLLLALFFSSCIWMRQ